MRLIYADDVKKRGDCYPPEVRSVISNILRHTKTIKDVAPVKHGHWEMDDPESPYGWVCTNCWSRACRSHDYCPHCGAKMDEVTT